MKKFGKIVNKVVLVTLVVLMMINIYGIVSTTVSDKKFSTIFGFSSSAITSGGMGDSMKLGDLAITKSQSDYEIGDIITYFDNGYFTHRIVEKTENGFITKGDSNSSNDYEITMSQIKGKVVSVVPKIGYHINFLKSPVGLLVLLALFVLLVKTPYIEIYKRENIWQTKTI